MAKHSDTKMPKYQYRIACIRNMANHSSRSWWLLLLVFSVALFSAALFLQHVLGFEPCELCIYQRVALLGIIISSLVSLLKPKSRVLCALSTCGAMYCAVRGALLAWQQIEIFLRPNKLHICHARAKFPALLPLDDWIPAIFEVRALCGGLSNLVAITMLMIFVVIVAVVVVANFKNTTRNM